MITREKARTLRRLIEIASAYLNDEDALQGVELFPHWDNTKTYAVDDKVNYEGTLYKCLQAHTAQPTWIPTDSPSLWARVLIPDPEIIPDWEQPDSTNAYMKGDKVRYNGKIYESLIDNNIWNPEAYPAGWSEVTE